MPGVRFLTATLLVLFAAACQDAGGGALTTVNPNGNVQGTVLGANGQAVSEITVELSATNFTTRTLQTGSRGEYEFTAVPAGNYSVRAIAAAGFVVSTPNPVAVTVRGGETVRADFRVAPFVTQP